MSRRSKSPSRRASKSPARNKRTKNDEESSTLTLSLRFEDIDEEKERAVIVNYGSEDVDLEGFHLRDIVGGNSSAPFVGPHIVPAKGSVTIWTAPGLDGSDAPANESASDFFWMNKSGGPRKQSVLNDEGDGLELVSSDDKLVLSEYIMTFRDKKKEHDVSSHLPLEFVNLDVDEELAVLKNNGNSDIDLEGFFLRDVVGGNRSAEFKGPHIVKSKQTVNIWTAPALTTRLKAESESDFFWMNKSGGMRKHAVLNDEGDGLELVSPNGNVAARAVAASFIMEEDSPVGKPKKSKTTKPSKDDSVATATVDTSEVVVKTTTKKVKAVSKLMSPGRASYTALSSPMKIVWTGQGGTEDILAKFYKTLREIQDEIFIEYDP